MSSFFDTNILVYIFDNSEFDKQTKAQSLFHDIQANDEIVLSTQVMQEFFVTVTRKLQPALAFAEAIELLHEFSVLRVVRIEPNIIIQAASRSQTMKFSLWDALIVEAALAADAKCLYTEDLQHGQVIDGLEIMNPFLR